jgi:hypothetical protein
MSGLIHRLLYAARFSVLAPIGCLLLFAPQVAWAGLAGDAPSDAPLSTSIMDSTIDPQVWDETYYAPLEDVDSTGPRTQIEESSILSFSPDPSKLLPGEFMIGNDSSGLPTTLAARAFDPYTFDYEAKTWGACSIFSDDLKIIRTFSRAYRSGNWSGNYAYLNCGPTSGKFGFNHIYDRHRNDWAAKAAYIGSAQWRHAADFGMYGALAYPQFIRYNTVKNTYCMNRWIYVNYRNQTVNRYKAAVVVGATGRRIITAWPSRSWCSAKDSVVIYDARP